MSKSATSQNIYSIILHTEISNEGHIESNQEATHTL